MPGFDVVPFRFAKLFSPANQSDSDSFG
jgi:hypothetical protein